MDSETERWVDGCLHYVEGRPLMVVLPKGYTFTYRWVGKWHIVAVGSLVSLCGGVSVSSEWRAGRIKRRQSAHVCQFCIRKLRAQLRSSLSPTA